MIECEAKLPKNPVGFHRHDDFRVWGVPGRSEYGSARAKPGKRIGVARDGSFRGVRRSGNGERYLF